MPMQIRTLPDYLRKDWRFARLALRGRHTLGHGYQEQHEEQTDAAMEKNHATQEVHHRDYQRHAQEHGTARALKAQVCQQLHHEHGRHFGCILLL